MTTCKTTRRSVLAGAASAAIVPFDVARANVSGDQSKLVELRAIVASIAKLCAEYSEALKRHSDAEEALFKALPAQPDRRRDIPAELLEIFDNITVAEFRAMPKDHPYAVWDRKTSAAFNAEYDAYRVTRARLSAEMGVDAAAKVVDAACTRLSRAEAEAMKNDAVGLEAIALKVRALRLANDDLESDQFDGVLATIDATARQAGV